MRAVLVVNPSATTTTERGRDVLRRALASEVDLRVAETRYKGHAASFATRCADAGDVDLIVSLGGDGTVNEIVNGLLRDGPRPGLPAIAVIPGGSTNVLARSLGLPRDPVEATGVVLDALRTGSRRMIGLGRADERYFTFCAGLGFDAEIVRATDTVRANGAKLTPAVHARTALRYFFTASDRRHPPMTVRRPGHRPEPSLYCAIVQNTSPWTYAGNTPMDPSPDASFDTGLDLFALRSMKLAATADQFVRMITAGRRPGGKNVLTWHDVDEFTVAARRPLPHQVDGEYIGERERVTFRSVPGAITLVL